MQRKGASEEKAANGCSLTPAARKKKDWIPNSLPSQKSKSRKALHTQAKGGKSKNDAKEGGPTKKNSGVIER